MAIETIDAYAAALTDTDGAICEVLRREIDAALPEAENRIWHAHPVWFLADNPVTGYSKLKGCVRLMFWSGQSFETPGQRPEGKFKAAEVRYTASAEIETGALRRWLAEAREIQWDYKNIVKRRGDLQRLA